MLERLRSVFRFPYYSVQPLTMHWQVDLGFSSYHHIPQPRSAFILPTPSATLPTQFHTHTPLWKGPITKFLPPDKNPLRGAAF